MKRITGIILAAVFIFTASTSFAADAKMIHHDSTWIANANVLSSDIKKGKGGDGVPIGTVVAWTKDWIPEGWLECNGQAVDATVYPELKTIVGNTVPDYRGYFLRHVGGNSAAIGAAQSDAIRNITGFIGYTWSTVFPNGCFYYGATKPNISASFVSDSVHRVSNVAMSASIVVPTAVENRPVNVAVKYLIRAQN